MMKRAIVITALVICLMGAEVLAQGEDYDDDSLYAPAICNERRREGIYLYPVEESCLQFYSCAPGHFAQIMNCSAGTLFDSEEHMCMMENQVDCGNRPRPPPPMYDLTTGGNQFGAPPPRRPPFRQQSWPAPGRRPSLRSNRDNAQAQLILRSSTGLNLDNCNRLQRRFTDLARTLQQQNSTVSFACRSVA